jgi:hypothetical protein
VPAVATVTGTTFVVAAAWAAYTVSDDPADASRGMALQPG